jgi:hypothetical protein|tara:strand:- start:71 stop:679 length:609 start_codon:yes stop_codon:yes gene_type:complete
LDSGLTPQEEKFAVALLAHGGKRKDAYLEVYGPGTKNVTSAAAKIATKPHIAARVRELLDDELEIMKATAKRTIAEVSRIAFADPLSIYDEAIYEETGKLVFKKLSDVPKGLRQSIKKVKPTKFGIEVEFHDKTRVLQDMQRRFGLLGERRDGESQQVHIHLDMSGKAKPEVIEVTATEPPAKAPATTENVDGAPNRLPEGP